MSKVEEISKKPKSFKSKLISQGLQFIIPVYTGNWEQIIDDISKFFFHNSTEIEECIDSLCNSEDSTEEIA